MGDVHATAEIDDFVMKLLNENHVLLRGGYYSSAGAILARSMERAVIKAHKYNRFFLNLSLKKIFYTLQADGKLAPPSKKEYVLRTMANRPGEGSQTSCQRMYCAIENDAFRLSGAFTQDTMFY